MTPNSTMPFRPCLVLPTYNNAGTLANIVERSLKLGHPVYVVDDGSTDATREITAALAGMPGLRVIRHNANQGKASAMRTGFAAAIGEGRTHALTIDTDGQLDPEQGPRLLEAARANPHTFVLGKREFAIARYPGRSRFGRRLANFLIWLECGVRVSDSQCGMRVYPLGLVQNVPVVSGRYDFETEVITRAGWAGTPVVEVPVSCRYFERGSRVSHYRLWVDTFRAIGLHARLLLRRLAPVPHARWPIAAQGRRSIQADDSDSDSSMVETVGVRVAK